METRQLGSSDLKVSAITFGAWAIGGWMWGGQDDADAVAAIRTALDAGVTTIDTAAVYGQGASEELVARALEGVPRDSVQILTKYALRWDTDVGSHHFDTKDNQGRPITIVHNARKDSVLYECEQSLRRLKTDFIDLYQCHWPDPETPVEETMEAVTRLLEQGKIRAAGVSNFTTEGLEAACAYVPLASNQPPYSMLDRHIEADVLPWCIEHNVGTLAYSPLQRGLLTGKIAPDYQFNEGDHRANNKYFSQENRKRVLAFLDEVRPIADAHGATLAQVAIAWTIARPGITAALVGARNEKQARENAAAADVKLAETETARINELLDGLTLDL